MPRTTPSAIADIISVEEGDNLSPFIEAASAIVDRVVATAKDEDGSPYYNEPQLELIERWLAAHFYAIYSPRARVESVSSLRVMYEGETGLGLEHTRYGQQAMLLDTAGGLARLNKQLSKGRAKIAVYWLGV